MYLNGEQVYYSIAVNSFEDNDRLISRTPVNILEGRNTLLVKTLNNFGDYSFTLNICEVEDDPNYFGNRVDGLKFYIDYSSPDTTISDPDTTISILPDYEISTAATLECYPNPASDYTIFRFNLERPESVSLQIYDLSGRAVKSFGREYRNAGIHEYTWHLDSNRGTRVRDGAYICNLQVGKRSLTVKLLVK